MPRKHTKTNKNPQKKKRAHVGRGRYAVHSKKVCQFGISAAGTVIGNGKNILQII